MQATQHHLSHWTTDTLPVGTRVICRRRNDAVGYIKSRPWRDVHDRRLKVWVDYTADAGMVAIDFVRDLEVAS